MIGIWANITYENKVLIDFIEAIFWKFLMHMTEFNLITTSSRNVIVKSFQGF